MPLTSLLLKLTKDLDDFQNFLDYEKEMFENKFINLKEEIVAYEGQIKTYQQKDSDDDDTEIDTKNESLQLELDDIKLKLEKEEMKNKGLEQDVDELNALIDLYVREAERRDYLELEWKDKTTKMFKVKIRNLEEEMFHKIGEIHNLENTIIELRCEINIKDDEIADLNEKLCQSCKV